MCGEARRTGRGGPCLGAALLCVASLGLGADALATAAPLGGRLALGSGLALEAPTHLPMRPGEHVTLRGALVTSHDGARLDASASYAQDGAVRGPGLFDLAAGGLRLAGSGTVAHDVRVLADEQPGAGCVAAGVASPCLLPRLGSLAHERLLTTVDFAGTLRGRLELVRAPVVPAAVAFLRLSERVGFALAGLTVLVGLAVAFVRWRRALAARPWGEVRTAAREVRALLGDDGTLGEVRRQVSELVERAERIERARRSAARLVGREGLRPAGAASAWMEDATAELSREDAARARLRAEVQAHEASLRKIASALRTACLLGRSSPAALVELAPGGLLVDLDDALSRRDGALQEVALLAPHGLLHDRQA